MNEWKQWIERLTLAVQLPRGARVETTPGSVGHPGQPDGLRDVGLHR